MRSEARNDNVEVVGEVCETGFNIMASAEAFEILSDRIYPNKILAVVRELSTNAVDATIDARKVAKLHRLIGEGAPAFALAQALNESESYVERELQTLERHPNYDLSDWVERVPVVHLPNKLEPWFSIRDYGTGLDHEFIMKLYTTYFFSDKKTSNDYTGCLGLGSKSPFAYTDHFTVTSYWNGQKRMYNAHLSNGFPAMTIFSDDNGNPIVYETDEPNGLEVSIAVKASDFEEFANTAKKLYVFFKMPLEIIGNTPVKNAIQDILDKKASGEYYTLHGEGDYKWGLRKDTSDYYSRGPRAIMGNIAYPISLQDTSGLDALERKILESSVDIEFPVGQLQITPSREQLSYKPSTINNIKTALAFIAGQIRQQMSTVLDDAKTLWEARCKANTLINSGEFGSLLNALNTNAGLTWKGQKVDQIMNVDVKIEGVTVYRFHQNHKQRETGTLPCSIDIPIYEVDMPRGSFGRCKLKASESNKQIYAVEFASAQARIDFLNALGMDPTTKFAGTSTLPRPTASARASYGNAGEVFKHVGYKTGRQYTAWKAVDPGFNLNDGGVFVEMYRNQIVKQGSVSGMGYDPSIIVDIMNALKELGDTVEVYGVRKSLVKEFKESDDWVEIYEYARKFLAQKIMNEEMGEVIANYKAAYEYGYFDTMLTMAKQVIPKIGDGPAKESLEVFIKIDESRKKIKPERYKMFNKLASAIGYTYEDKPYGNPVDEVNKLQNNYPMLEHALPTSSNLESVVNYINLLDVLNSSGIMSDIEGVGTLVQVN